MPKGNFQTSEIMIIKTLLICYYEKYYALVPAQLKIITNKILTKTLLFQNSLSIN